MTNQMQSLEEASKRAYYDTSSDSLELGSHRLSKEWSLHSVLFLMVIAIILWVFSYTLVMGIMSLYDEGHKSVYVLDVFYWLNDTCDDEKKPPPLSDLTRSWIRF